MGCTRQSNPSPSFRHFLLGELISSALSSLTKISREQPRLEPALPTGRAGRGSRTTPARCWLLRVGKWGHWQSAACSWSGDANNGALTCLCYLSVSMLMNISIDFQLDADCSCKGLLCNITNHILVVCQRIMLVFFFCWVHIAQHGRCWGPERRKTTQWCHQKHHSGSQQLLSVWAAGGRGSNCEQTCYCEPNLIKSCRASGLLFADWCRKYKVVA